jgi:hypothetical protein
MNQMVQFLASLFEMTYLCLSAFLDAVTKGGEKRQNRNLINLQTFPQLPTPPFTTRYFPNASKCRKKNQSTLRKPSAKLRRQRRSRKVRSTNHLAFVFD